MLIFLRNDNESNDIFTKPIKTPNHNEPAVFLNKYTKTFPQITNLKTVPWYSFNEDPQAFGKTLLEVASADAVCQALIERACATWGLDFSIASGCFNNKYVQEHYLKLLRNWLNPLSGNLGRREAHLTDVEKQYEEVWKKLNLDRDKLRQIAAKDFFKKNGFNVAGRRDRVQLYRHTKEAARALVGEVTSWPSRYVEKIAALSLLCSPRLAELQRQMLGQVVKEDIHLTCTKWEYLPYYLRGKALERCEEQDAEPRVLGALHDCLGEGESTKNLAKPERINKLKQLDGGKEYARWRKLPQVVRYQILINDLARMMGDKIDSKHWRFEFNRAKLESLPNVKGFDTWKGGMKEYESANPHDPGCNLRFATGWNRNEFCPNVISSRLLLAPLYAGTSGHNQGRILKWRELNSLAPLPVGLIISAGYSVLWRLYYDKRVSGFHTMFETLQGTHVDSVEVDTDAPKFKGNNDDEVWNKLIEHSPKGKTDVSEFWRACITLFAKRGTLCPLKLKSKLTQARDKAMKQLSGAVLPHWGATANPELTAPEVTGWDEKENNKVAERLLFEIALNTPLPDDDEL